MDRIEYINDLQNNNNEFKTTRKQSIITNNFFSLASIIMISIAIILYVNYVVPAQDAKKQRELNIQKYQDSLNSRIKRIALSHKMNQKSKENNETK